MKLKLAVAATLLASAANAQNYNSDVNNNTPRGQSILSTATINSGTIPQPAPVAPFETVGLTCVGTASTVSVSVQRVLRDGSLVRSTTHDCTTTAAQLVSTTTVNVDYEGLVVSPTAGLTGTNTLTIRVLRLPSVPKQF